MTCYNLKLSDLAQRSSKLFELYIPYNQKIILKIYQYSFSSVPNKVCTSVFVSEPLWLENCSYIQDKL